MSERFPFIDTLTRRILWLLILLTVLPTMVIGVFSYLRFVHAVQFTLQEVTDRIAWQIGGGIEKRFEAILPSVDLLAENREVRVFYNRHWENPGLAWTEIEPKLAEYFDRFFEVFGDRYLQMIYLDASGRPLFRVRQSAENRLGGGERQKAILTRDVWSSQDRGDPGIYQTLPKEEDAFRVVLVQVPSYDRVLRVYRRVSPSGFLIADLRREALWSEDLSSRVFGAQGYIAIVDRADDRLLFHTETQRANRELTEVYPSLQDRYEEMKRQEHGWVQFDTDGEEWLVSYVNLTSPPWTIMVAASGEEFLDRPRITGMMNLGMTAAFVIVAMVAIVSFWSKVRERTAVLARTNRTLETQKEEVERAYRELRETQAQLVQSEKMASLGQLVAGVAHELNNPIGFVYANIHSLRKSLNELKELFSKGEENARVEVLFRRAEELLEGCRHGAERAKQIVTDLRTFSRLDEAEFKQADIHEGIESTLTLLSHQLKDRITVHRDYGEIPPIDCYPGQLNQVFMNLLANAAEAIQGRGDIWIRTVMERDEVVISIRDNGSGIPEEHLEKLFTPFFTTKEVGRGTGLGLSVTYGILQRHGGQISVESEVGKGSTFTLRLPMRRVSTTSSSEPMGRDRWNNDTTS